MASLRDIGQNLKEAREAQGVTLEDIATKTRITVRHLIALEEGNESDLPEVFYVRGFLKKYAEAVGLSPKDVADAYRAAPIPTPSAPSMGASAGPIIYYLAILSLIGGCLWLAWYFQPKISVVAEPSPTPSPSASPSPSPNPTPVAIGPMPAPTASAVSLAASAAPASAQPSAAVLAASAGPDASPEANSSPAASLAPSAAPSARPSVAESVRPSVAPSVAPSPRSTPRSTPRPSPKASALPQGQVSVTLTIQSRSWVEVVVNGTPAYEGLLSPGARRSFTGRTVEVSAGNAGGVRINVDGRDRGLLGGYGVVMTRSYRPE